MPQSLWNFTYLCWNLTRLGYSEEQAAEVVSYIEQNGTIEGSPHLRAEHLAVFDCSLKPARGERAIPYMGHVLMMAAVQPFLSGAISKTVNMPEETTADEIAQVYSEAWRLGLKSIAIYRDGSKRTQPLNTRRDESRKGSEVETDTALAPSGAPGEPKTAGRQPMRRRLPDERRALTHHFSVGGYEGYITVGFYDDGQPGEIFITRAKEG